MPQAFILRAKSCCCWESLVFGIVVPSTESLCASPLAPSFIQAWTSRRFSGCPCHLAGLWLGAWQNKVLILKSWSWHHELPAAMGLLWASWDSSFILPVVPGAAALPTACLAGNGNHSCILLLVVHAQKSKILSISNRGFRRCRIKWLSRLRLVFQARCLLEG